MTNLDSILKSRDISLPTKVHLVKATQKAMAPHSSTLTWKIPWTEEPGRLQSMGSWRVGHDWATSLSLSLSCIGEGNGNPLQCYCLENPRDGGAWWAAVCGVVQSRTRLKRLSSSSSSSMMYRYEFHFFCFLYIWIHIFYQFSTVLSHSVFKYCLHSMCLFIGLQLHVRCVVDFLFLFSILFNIPYSFSLF